MSSWQVREIAESEVETLAAELSVHSATARCLLARGVTCATSARAFLEPRLQELRPPTGLPDLAIAVECLADALGSQATIGVFGDYDVDGVTTAALLTSALESFTGSVVPRVASRARGYGFGDADAEYFLSRGCSVVIIGDCGTSDREPIRRLQESGIRTIVIDHHTVPDDPQQHPAHALINPFRADSQFPFTGLASVGLAFYVVCALRTHLRRREFFTSRPLPDVRELLDLVALGTIADLVPLIGENRILARAGLARLALARRPGLRALYDHAGVVSGAIDARAVGFKIGPRLNAPGRLGDAQPALDLLLAKSAVEAEAAAAVVEQCNDERRAAQHDVWEQVLGQLEGKDVGPAIVVAGVGWPSGVVGIVAARLVDMYQRPAFVIAVDEETGIGRGSGRTARGINLYEALAESSELLIRFGGHAAAAGLTIEGDRIDELSERLSSFTASRGASSSQEALTADAAVSLADVDERLVAELEALGPFGMANAEPLLVAERVSIRSARRVGDGSHLKLEIASDAGRTIAAIGFGLGEQHPQATGEVDIAFRPAISTWRGRRTLELELKALSS